MSPYTVVTTEGLEADPMAWLKQQVTVIELSMKEPARWDAALAQADGIIVRTYTQVNRALIARAPRLKVVGRAGVGLENIDQSACAAAGIKVISTPHANTNAVREYVFNLIFALGRPIIRLTEPVDPDTFHAYRRTSRGLELFGLTLGVLGMGRLGRAVSRTALAMGMKVIYNDVVDVSPDVDFPAESVALDELLRRADILTIHVSHRPGNRHFINAARLKLMKPTALLINTARGEVIDAGALADAIESQRLAGAALDVHDPEPPRPDYPLWHLDRVILAPHLAARTQGAMDAMSWVARDVVEYLRTQAPRAM
ncbi:MAG: NAD(P)-dependent oxidoreductase [Phycisphaerae bacterium]